MDLQLLNYISKDMKWNIIRKGRTGMTRRRRKLGEDIFDLVNESSTFETKKFSVDKVVDELKKKRRLLHQSPLPISQTPCLNGGVEVSPGPQTPAVVCEDVGQRLSSLSKSKKTKSKTRLRKSNVRKPKKNMFFNVDDFSGIELLVAAACGSFVNDSADRVDDISVSEEQTTPGFNSCNIANKEAIDLPELNASSVQVENKVIPSKGLRLHWDLNTVMDEWEEPCDDLHLEPHSQKNCSKSVNSTSDAFGVEEKVMLDYDAAISVMPLVTGTKMPISKTSDGESSIGKSDVIDLLPNQEKCEDFSTSTTSVLREQNNVIGESDLQSIFEEVTQDEFRSPRLCKSSCDDRVTLEYPLSEGCGSNVTQDEQGLATEGDSEQKLEVGYDSPFEDGELREPIENPFSEKDDTRTVENTLSEKVDQGQTMEDQRSSLVKEVVPNNVIKQGPREDTFKSPTFSERKDKDESTSFDIRPTRSSNFGDPYSRSGMEPGAEKSTARDIVMNQFHSRHYYPRGDAYRTQNRRCSPSERNNCYGSYRGPPIRYHSRDRYRGEYHDFKPSYLERKPHFLPKLNRPRSRSRSRSGSPIAWNFQKHKNSDTCNSGEIEATTKGHVSPPERSSKLTDDKNRDKRRSPDRMIQRKQRSEPNRYPERLKSDDHFQHTHHSARFSQMSGSGRDHRIMDNNDAIRKHYSHNDKVNRLGRHDDGFRRFRDNDTYENRNRRNLDSFSTDSPKR